MSIQHSDLHEALYEIAVNAGVRVEFNSNVVAVDPETPSVTLNGGKKVYGDIVIGTDGDQSLVRKLMFDEGEEEEMVEGPWTGYVWVLMSCQTSMAASVAHGRLSRTASLCRYQKCRTTKN